MKSEGGQDRADEAGSVAGGQSGSLVAPASERRQMAGAYFLYFLTFGLFLPYFPPFLRSRGLDGEAIGLVLALAPLMRIVVPPVLGAVADRVGGPRFWGTIAAWGAAGGMAVIWLSDGPLLLGAGILLYFAATAPAIPLLDAATVQALRGSRSRFGQIRSWGSAGFTLSSLGLGLLYPSLPARTIVVSLVVSHVLFALFVSLVRMEDAPPGRPHWGEVPALLANPGVWLLVGVLFLSRVASAEFNAFYTLFVGELGLGGDIVAWTWGIAITTEICVMLVVDRWIDRFGFWWVLAFGTLLEAVRWVCYAFAGSAAGLLLLAPWHGLAFATMHVAFVRGVTEMVPAKMRSMGQGLGTAAAGVGQMVGFVGAGYLTGAVGSRWTFLVSGFVGALTVTFILLFGRASRARSPIGPTGQ
jgi:MFS transporter, PPP family, 3-phenylpropionic acid transporter